MIPFDENALALFQKLVIEWNEFHLEYESDIYRDLRRVTDEIESLFKKKFDFGMVLIYGSNVDLYNKGDISKFAKIDYDSEIILNSSPSLRVYSNTLYNPLISIQGSKRDTISTINEKFDLDLPLVLDKWTMDHILMLRMIL